MQAIPQTCRLMKTTSTLLLLLLGVTDREGSACHRTVLLCLSVCTSLPLGDFFWRVAFLSGRLVHAFEHAKKETSYGEGGSLRSK